MRVAHLLLGRCNPDSANGVDKSVYHLVCHQAVLGAEVAVFSLTAKEPIAIPGVEVHGLPPPSTMFGRLSPKVPNQVLNAVLNWKPDLVHFHSVHIGPFIGLARTLRRYGIPYAVTPHGGFASGRLARVGSGVRAYIYLLEKEYLEQALFVHAVSNNDVEGLKSLGVRAQTIVVPNGITVSEIPNRSDGDLLRGQFPNLVGKFVFVFLGRLDPGHKGLDILLEAFAKVQMANAALVLIGPDWRRSLSLLKDQAKQLGVTERVVFAGPAFGEQKWGYLRGADVFVHPPRSEAGCPFSVLEALAVGKAVIVSKAADPEGQIGTFGAGLVTEPEVGGLCEALTALTRYSRESLIQMGLRGRMLVETRYDWQIIAERLLGAYENWKS